MIWYSKVPININKRNTLLLEGLINENIDCQNINTIFTISRIVLNSFLLFLYKFFISLNLFIHSPNLFYVIYLQLTLSLINSKIIIVGDWYE